MKHNNIHKSTDFIIILAIQREHLVHPLDARKYEALTEEDVHISSYEIIHKKSPKHPKNLSHHHPDLYSIITEDHEKTNSYGRF